MIFCTFFDFQFEERSNSIFLPQKKFFPILTFHFEEQGMLDKNGKRGLNYKDDYYARPMKNVFKNQETSKNFLIIKSNYSLTFWSRDMLFYKCERSKKYSNKNILFKKLYSNANGPFKMFCVVLQEAHIMHFRLK